MKILIIEDEPKVRRALKKLLLEIDSGIEWIQEAETGLEGLACIESEEPDLILLDMIMPEMNGNELLERIRIQKIETPVIVVSGHHDFDLVKQALSNEAIEYILKPFDKEDVESAFNKAKEKMEKHHFQRQTERLLQEMMKEQEQFHLAPILNRLYEGTMLTDKEYALLPSFVQDQACEVCVIVIKNYEETLLERFHRDKSLLEYAIRKLLAEYSDLAGTVWLNGLSGRYEWCHWLISPSTPLFAEWMDGLLQVLEKVLKLHCFVIKEDEPQGMRSYSSSINTLEDMALYLDISYAQSKQIFGQSEVKSRIMSTPSLLETRTAFVPKACHLIKHQLTFRIRGELETLFAEASSAGQISAMFLFQTWTMLHTRVEAELGYHEHAIETLHRIEPFVLRIAFDKTKALQLFADRLDVFISSLSGITDKKMQRSRALAVKEYIDICFREPISLADLAERFFISKEYLASQFKRQFDLTVVQYIHMKRMETARNMLMEDELSVSAIASAVGYDHFSYFDKLFKREYGSTPSAFRLQFVKGKAH